MDLRGKKILFLGDSITQGAGATKKENVYLEVCAKKLGAKAVNFGVGGTRIAPQITPSAEAFCDEYFLLRAKKMDKEADLVVVFGGTNDFGHGDAPFGVKTDRTPYTFCGAFNLLTEYLIENFGREKICFILPLHRKDENSMYGDGSKKTAGRVLSEYVQKEIEILTEKGIDYLDVREIIPAGKLDELTVDGLHPNKEGHKLIAAKVTEKIKKLSGNPGC